MAFEASIFGDGLALIIALALSGLGILLEARRV
jgi:hypothetical protein